MSELPEDLRALLDLAKDGHDPTDPGARGRVRHAIAASLMLASGTGASSSVFPEAAANNTLSLAQGAKAAKAGWVLFGSKVTTLAAGTAAVVGLSFATYHYAPKALPAQAARTTTAQDAPTNSPLRSQADQGRSDSAQQERAAAARVESPTTQATAVADATAMRAATAQAGKLGNAGRPRKARPSADEMAAEMALVRAASDALARGDEATALTMLHEHARRFASGNLRLEREGLSAIAECTRDSAPSSASAKRFLRLYPHSLLSARVTKACAVE